VPILGGVAKWTAQANRVAVAPSDPGAGHVTEAGAHRGRLRSRWPSFREPTAYPRYAGCRPVERAAGTEREQSARNDDRVAATRARDHLERTLVTISSAPGWRRLDPVFKQDPWRACSSLVADCYVYRRAAGRGLVQSTVEPRSEGRPRRRAAPAEAVP
jgi:hypothetical protein